MRIVSHPSVATLLLAPYAVTSVVAGEELSTAFSCGARWTSAKSCSALCPSGNDSECPDGQRCYGGIPCTGDDDVDMEKILEEQSRLEDLEMDRLKLLREENGYEERFVCGESHEVAEASCGGGSSLEVGNGEGLGLVAHYCPTGESSQCPTGMECYAAVSCPRGSMDYAEPSSVPRDAPILVDSTIAAAPSLVNGSMGGDDDGSVQGGGSWSYSFLADYAPSSLGRKVVSSLLTSSGYGLN